MSDAAPTPKAIVPIRQLHYEVYRSDGWRWRLRAANNRILADGSEAYHNRADCLHDIDLVKGSREAPVTEADR